VAEEHIVHTTLYGILARNVADTFGANMVNEKLCAKRATVSELTCANTKSAKTGVEIAKDRLFAYTMF
jgi:hypothetical protein